MVAHPTLRMLHHFHAPALHPSPARFAGRMLGKVVVEIKSAVEPGGKSLAVQNHSADERRRVVTLRLEQFRPGGMIGRQRHGEVGDAVCARQQPRQNRGVRGIGNRAGSKRLLEADAILRQAVQCRSLYLLVAITMNMVSPQRIDGH